MHYIHFQLKSRHCTIKNLGHFFNTLISSAVKSTQFQKLFLRVLARSKTSDARDELEASDRKEATDMRSSSSNWIALSSVQHIKNTPMTNTFWHKTITNSHGQSNGPMAYTVYVAEAVWKCSYWFTRSIRLWLVLMTNQMPGEGGDCQPPRLPREHPIGCLHPPGHGCPLWVIHETLWSFLNDLSTPEIIKSIFDYQNNSITNKI